MSTFEVIEFQQIERGPGGNVQIPYWDSQIVEQSKTHSGATQSDAFNAKTRYIAYCSSIATRVAFGTNPTATAASLYVGVGQVFWVAVPVGQSWKISSLTA